MPGCIVSATTASFRSVEKRRRRATPVITSTFENVSDIGVCLGLYLGPPAKAGVRSKRGAVHPLIPSPRERDSHAGDSQGEGNMIHRGKREGVCHGGGGSSSQGLRGRANTRAGEAV